MREPFTPGVHEGMPAAAYHSVEALSSTFLKRMFSSSALHAQHDREHFEPNDSMRLGTALHTRILLPELYECEIAVSPDVDRRTKDGKAAYAEFVAASVDKTVIDAEDHVAVLGMEEAIRGSNAAETMLEMCSQRELSVFAEDPDTGAPLKARLDAYDPETGWILDIKTTRDASLRAFKGALWGLGYGIGSSFYRKVARLADLKVAGFAFLCVENARPHGVAVYAMDDSDMDEFDFEVRRLIADYKVCRSSNRWPGYPDTIQRIGLAGWAKRQLEEAHG